MFLKWQFKVRMKDSSYLQFWTSWKSWAKHPDWVEHRWQKPNQGRSRSELQKKTRSNHWRCAAPGADPQQGGESTSTGVKDRFLEVRETKVSLGRIAPCTCKYAISSSTVNPLRRQQGNITFIRANDCNSAALTLSRAAQIADAQALGFCPLHTTENIKNVRTLRGQKNQLLQAQAQLLPGQRIAFQPVWTAVRCGRRFSSISSWAKCKVIVVIWWASDRNWMNSPGVSRISFQLAQFR